MAVLVGVNGLADASAIYVYTPQRVLPRVLFRRRCVIDGPWTLPAGSTADPISKSADANELYRDYYADRPPLWPSYGVNSDVPTRFHAIFRACPMFAWIIIGRRWWHHWHGHWTCTVGRLRRCRVQLGSRDAAVRQGTRTWTQDAGGEITRLVTSCIATQHSRIIGRIPHVHMLPDLELFQRRSRRVL